MKSAPTWYAISKPSNSQDGEDNSPVEITIYDEIGGFGVLAKDFVNELKKYKGRLIDLRINSVGGSVIDGDAIFNALRRHKGGLIVHIDGLAASMASVIAMAGDEIRMADNALMMIHNPWSMSVGDADAFRKEADTLDKIKEAMVRTYARRTGLARNEVSEMMTDERWMDAEEALRLGFIDEIDDSFAAAASVTREEAQSRFDKFKNSMSRKTKSTIKAEEAAPAVVEPTVEAPVTDDAVDTSAEDNMNAELQAKVDALQAELNAKVEADTVRAQADEVTAKELETLKAEVERLSAESASKDEEIAILRAEQKSAGEQAAAIVASVGIDTAATPVVPELTAAQKFAALEGPEATQFFRANKAEILKTFYS